MKKSSIMLILLVVTSTGQYVQASSVFNSLWQRTTDTFRYQWRPLAGMATFAALAYNIKNPNAKIAATTCAILALYYAIKSTPDKNTLEGIISATAHNIDLFNTVKNTTDADNISSIVRKLINELRWMTHAQKDILLHNEVQTFIDTFLHKYITEASNANTLNDLKETVNSYIAHPSRIKNDPLFQNNLHEPNSLEEIIHLASQWNYEYYKIGDDTEARGPLKTILEKLLTKTNKVDLQQSIQAFINTANIVHGSILDYLMKNPSEIKNDPTFQSELEKLSNHKSEKEEEKEAINEPMSEAHKEVYTYVDLLRFC